MIDKNDVKMPVQTDDVGKIAEDPERLQNVEDLLELVNAAENKQELRLGADYYSRFHWFGNIATRQDKSYFSYQEEAVYDFIFNLNKSGILSDQVGMGKTIEAGMIISELASRNELRSLLIVVPNEIMADKWGYELENKFGIRAYVRMQDGKRQEYPQVKTIKNYDDFCRCVFDCVSREKFAELYDHKFEHKYEAKNGVRESLGDVIKRFIQQDIKAAVEMMNSGFEIGDMPGDPRVSFDGHTFSIADGKFYRDYVEDAKGELARYLNGKQNLRPENVVNSNFFRSNYERIIKAELDSLYTLVGDYFTTLPDEIASVAEGMAGLYPILVIPIAYSEQIGKAVRQRPFLNRTLPAKVENYKHKYIIKDKTKDEMEDLITVYEDYRIIDFFIDVGYQTLIVDEVHDYIDVSAKVERRAFHKNPEQYEKQFSSGKYDRYELFDDYYFIKKQSLYKKLKGLADKAKRKVFLTATPIKSDMVDFYLLTLIASNKDAEAYKLIGSNLESAFKKSEEREQKIEMLYNDLKQCIQEYAAKNFCENPTMFLKCETDPTGKAREGKYLYPYFNNKFLLENVGNMNLIMNYLLGQISYMSMEEIVLELIIAYNAERKTDNKVKGSELAVAKVIEEIDSLLSHPGQMSLQTRVVFRALLNNTIRIRFEEDFTEEIKDENGNVIKSTPIKQIRQLLEMEDGPRRWNKTYRKYGIRHTRHQTYNLSKCDSLDKLNKNKVERYRNLPVWPRRDGKVIFLLRDDYFFDSYLNVRRERKDEAEREITLRDLPNYDKMVGEEAEREERFRNAKAIFDYINDAMSGGKPGSHEPQSSHRESVDLNDEGMVDYKLALVNQLMVGRDSALGAVRKKVLLFAEKGRELIREWFYYQKCEPIYDGGELDPKKLEEYRKKWARYGAEPLGGDWRVSESTDDLSRFDGNLLIIIDPTRYEKGVDLQKADTIINFDINYDPLKMEQRIGRIDRIRPNGQSPEINIVSFIPFNDMSGFVINFFANEMKMFTQWMGETTGIVSVPDEDDAVGKGQDVSFEGKVLSLEKYYKDIYDLCTSEKVQKGELESMAEEFSKFFGIDKARTTIDFRFLYTLRESFDRAFRNSITPRRAGNVVTGSTKRVVRFNSTQNPFLPCAAERCNGCKSKNDCASSASGARRNLYKEFSSAVRAFFEAGEKFYKAESTAFFKELSDRQIGGEQEMGQVLLDDLRRRQDEFRKTKDSVQKLLPSETDEVFTMTFEKYGEIFAPMKKMYWDDVVETYIRLILERFYKQCDSVLKGAKLFERFIKTFSIAEFMNNMEVTQ